MEWFWILIICTAIIIIILLLWCIQILLSERRRQKTKKRNLRFEYTARQSHLHTIISQGDMERTYTYDSRNSINSHALKQSVPSIRVGSISKESSVHYQEVRLTAKLESERFSNTIDQIAIDESH